MSLKQRYQLQRYGKLLMLKAVVADTDGVYQSIRLLVDTGATYTVLPVGFLREMGYDVTKPDRRVRISAASGVMEVPLMKVDRFSCLGQNVADFSVVALDLPPSAVISGLLGMDFLERHQALIDTGKAEIVIPDRL
jgi:predicted aspartyl protease